MKQIFLERSESKIIIGDMRSRSRIIIPAIWVDADYAMWPPGIMRGKHGIRRTNRGDSKIQLVSIASNKDLALFWGLGIQ